MKNLNLDNFGKLLMTQVRDRTISDIRSFADGSMRGKDAVKIREILSLNPSKEQLTNLLVPYVVDRTLANLLDAIEQMDGVLLFSADRSLPAEDLKSIGDGLVGEMFGDGWISQFSSNPQSILGE